MSGRVVAMPRAGAGSLAGGSETRAQVLVVDDEPLVLEVLARWLNQAGYAVTTAPGFFEAMAVLHVSSPQALVIDVCLRDFNGLQLALHARAQNPEACIVMISGWDDPVLRREAEACHATYMCKPFSAAALLSALGVPPPQLVTES